jgi:hypothetical protein
VGWRQLDHHCEWGWDWWSADGGRIQRKGRRAENGRERRRLWRGSAVLVPLAVQQTDPAPCHPSRPLTALQLERDRDRDRHRQGGEDDDEGEKGWGW